MNASINVLPALVEVGPREPDWYCAFCGGIHSGRGVCRARKDSPSQWWDLYESADVAPVLLCAMSTGDADSFRTFEGDLQFTTADPGVVYAEGMWKARLLCARVSDFGGLQLVMGQLVFDTRVDLELIEKMLWPLVFDDNVGAAVREQIEHVQTAITDATARLKEGRYYDVQLCIDRCKYDARDEMVGDRVVRDILAEMKAERERLRLEMKELLASADKSTRYV